MRGVSDAFATVIIVTLVMMVAGVSYATHSAKVRLQEGFWLARAATTHAALENAERGQWPQPVEATKSFHGDFGANHVARVELRGDGSVHFQFAESSGKALANRSLILKPHTNGSTVVWQCLTETPPDIELVPPALLSYSCKSEPPFVHLQHH
ncbi:MAG: pilin [Pseudomonadota bacterium]